MFRQEHHSGLVVFSILLHEVFHGFNQQPLSFNVARILNAFLAFTPAGVGKNWNGKNFGHCAHLSRLLASMPDQHRLLQSSRQIIESKQQITHAAPLSHRLLRLHNFGSGSGFQAKNIIRDFAVHPDVGVMRETIIPARFKKLLLDGDVSLWIHPQQNVAE